MENLNFKYTLINGELYHHGIKGMKWGVRRYQNEDGSLTEEGQKRLVNSIKKSSKAWYGARNHDKITDDVKNEIERNAISKEQKKKLVELTNQAAKLSDNAYKIKDAKKRREAIKKAEKAEEKYFQEMEKVVDSLVGQYGDTKIETYYANMHLVSSGRILVREAVLKLSGWHFY